MNQIMTWENLDSFAYTNREIIKGEIRGIVLCFIGLGGAVTYFGSQNTEGIKWSKKNVLYVHPYNNPWNWMNRQAIDYTDEILDVIFDHYALPESTPVISTGGSMGGESALVYTRYAKRTPKACLANCPVCDMPFHYTERRDLPRTLYSAFYNEEGTVDEVLSRYSPLHLAHSMPDVPYYIFHCTADKEVNIDAHSEKFVAAMTPAHDVTYIKVPDLGHCQLTPDMLVRWDEYIMKEIGIE